MPEITEAELFKEIDGLAKENSLKGRLTDLQFNAIDYSRKQNVPWSKMDAILEKIGLGDINRSTLKSRYALAKDRRINES